MPCETIHKIVETCPSFCLKFPSIRFIALNNYTCTCRLYFNLGTLEKCIKCVLHYPRSSVYMVNSDVSLLFSNCSIDFSNVVEFSNVVFLLRQSQQVTLKKIGGCHCLTLKIRLGCKTVIMIQKWNKLR